ncbi:intermembrane phospholipid transport protein YdbH family protein [Sphingomonas morindae]|uniref:YdbH domain-containing protein n=1 Tax=Sphingomonas morindae TaxID=1541170 RepID=A0ABY4XAD0_9SPHN|nr:YdbH domain-containing protein [Sphingomonas morindae]USI73830.1 YdbH domain-containing protein [Sphingomonas morindae]
MALATGTAILLVLGGVWIERQTLVRGVVDRELARRGVRASYRLVSIGPFHERLADLRIGDPRAPDLTVRSLDLALGYGAGGAQLRGVRAEGVRLAARIDSRGLSLGALDRLRPQGRGAAGLPDLALTLADARLALATPAGAIAARLDGRGNAARDFSGRLTLAAPQLRPAPGCRLTGLAGTLAVRVAGGGPELAGPLTLAGLRCGGAALGPARIDGRASLSPALDRWEGRLALAAGPGAAGPARIAALNGALRFAGDRRATTGMGTLRLAAPRLAAAGLRAAEASLTGRLVYAGGVTGSGTVHGTGLALDPDRRRALAAFGRAAASTPAGPVAAAIGAAAARLARAATLDARIALDRPPGGPRLRLADAMLRGASGGALRLAGTLSWPAGGGIALSGQAASAGDGLPRLTARFARPRGAAPLTATILAAPYEAGAARLALTPVTLRYDAGTLRLATRLTADGPIGGGRVEGLTLPLALAGGAGGWRLESGCVPIGFARLAVAGMTLEEGRLRGCGRAGAPIAAIDAAGRLRAGLMVADLRLAGRSGTAPLSLAADRVTLDQDRFDVTGLAVRLGAGATPTRLDIAALDGAFGARAGRFHRLGGQIGSVPLIADGGEGEWREADGALVLAADFTLSDAQAPARFQPLAGRGLALRLDQGRVTATTGLTRPGGGATLAEVTLRHDLNAGRGSADIAVPDLAFTPALQPEALTRLTLGVIANARGHVRGRARIDWAPGAITSQGDFETERLDFAAAFGPVTGLSGRVHFNDLLALATPPGQEVRIAEVNPGVPVTQGVLHYQLLPGQKVALEEGHWPFARGQLTLDPSLLAFDQDSERRLTFRVRGADAAAFVQDMAAPNLAATGLFDGTLPMVFDQRGGRIEGGEMVARPPGGTLAYIGALSQENVGRLGALAFDALKAIRYSALAVDLDGRLDGEIVSRVRFTGVREATPGAGLVARLIRNLPFRFSIAIRAPFRALLGTARSYADPSLLLAGTGLPAAAAPSSPAIQPAVSDAMADHRPR